MDSTAVAGSAGGNSGGTVAGQQNLMSNGSGLSHIVLVDWELFCMGDGNSSRAGAEATNASEVIQFAWAIHDASIGEIVSQRCCYVKPANVDTSAIPLATYNIDPATFDSSITSLQDAVSEFNHDFHTWQQMSLNSVANGQQQSLAVVTACYSAMKRSQFFADAQSKGISSSELQPWFSMLDLREIIVDCYPQLRDGELASPRLLARRLLGTPYDAQTELTGLDLCSAFSNIFKRMTRDGFSVPLFSSFVSNIDFQLEINKLRSPPAASQWRSSGATQQTSNPVPLQSGTSVHVVRLRGIPLDATVEDVVEFFKPIATDIRPAQVHLDYDMDGRVSGLGYVETNSLEVRDNCLKELHGKFIGRRWIEVFRATEDELQRYLQTTRGWTGGYCQTEKDKMGVLRLRGLPWSANEYEIKRFFSESNFTVEVNNVYLGTSVDNRPSGEAWVVFPTSAEAEEARKQMHRKTIGRRYIEVFSSTLQELETARNGGSQPPRYFARQERLASASPYPMHQNRGAYGVGHRDEYGGSPYYGAPVPSYGYGGARDYDMHDMMRGGNRSRHGPGDSYNSYSRGMGGGRDNVNIRRVKDHDFPFGTTVLRMRGLPFTSTEHNITDFFKGYAMAAILPTTAPINGKPSGEAYVEFVNAEEANRAANDRNGGMIDRRYIELFPSSKQEFEHAAAGMDPREIRRKMAAAAAATPSSR